MNSLINFKMFTRLTRAHMATRSLELARAEVDAEDLSGFHVSGWRGRDATCFMRRAHSGGQPMDYPVVLR